MRNDWSIRPSLKYIPVIIVVGIGIGIGTHALGTHDTLTQAILLHVVTSLSIGYPLVLIGLNRQSLFPDRTDIYQAIALGLLFAFIGFVGSEIELLVKALLFEAGSFQLLTGGGLYLFNAILTVVLGFGILNAIAQTEPPFPDPKTPTDVHSPLDAIPIKKGDSIHLIPLATLSLFEAAGKYAYAYDVSGQKYLTDHSLAFLEERLPASFIRIHRSYIVNKSHIATVQAYDKKRYTIDFTSKAVPEVISSAGYRQTIRELINI